MHRSVLSIVSLCYLFGLIQTTSPHPIQIKKITMQERDAMKGDLRLIAGIRANPSDFPYRAALEIPYGLNGDMSACEGSLIGPSTVMTSATCMREMPPVRLSSLKVNLNTSYFRGGDAGSISVNAIDYRLHKYFNTDTMDYDIALIYLRSPVTTIKPLALPCANSNYNGATGVIAGWGPPAGTQNRAQYFATFDPMMKTNMTILSPVECSNRVPSISLTRMCVVAQGTNVLCEGGLGGTLVVNGRAVGIASDNSGCSSNSASPSIFTNISTVLPWINAYIKPPVYA